MAQKNFLEIFNAFKPSSDVEDAVLLATDIKVRVDKEKRFAEIKANFPKIIRKQLLYKAEHELERDYNLSCVRILPSYPTALLNERYIPEILTETERVGVVAKGFFAYYDFVFDGQNLTVKIPFVQGGITLLYDANTPSVIENIIFSEFNTRVHVTIERDENATLPADDIFSSQMEQINEQLKRAEIEYDNRAHQAPERGGDDKSASANPSAPALPRAVSV